jgi:hypothetical protein
VNACVVTAAPDPPFRRRLALYWLGYLRRADLAFLRAGLCRTGDVARRHRRGLLSAIGRQAPLPAVMAGTAVASCPSGWLPDRRYSLGVGPPGAACRSNQAARCPEELLAGTARDFMNIVYRAVGKVDDCMATGLDQLAGLDAAPGGTVVRRLTDQRAVAY